MDLGKLTPEQDSAFRSAISDYTGAALVTSFVVVAETVDAGGEQGLAILTNEELASWSAHGMLASAAAVTRDGVVDGFNR